MAGICEFYRLIGIGAKLLTEFGQFGNVQLLKLEIDFVQTHWEKY